MPQLEQFWSFPGQIFWLIVTFGMLYFVLARVALPKVFDVLQERQERIDDDIEKAEQLKKEAESALAAYEKAIADARGKAQAQIREAADAAAQEAARRQAELVERLARDSEVAEQRIDAARREALGNIQSVSSELAAAAVARLIGEQVSQAESEAAVAGEIKERA